MREKTTATLPSWARPDAPTWTWVGVLVIGAGFALLGVTWGQVAAEAEVYRQIPYVISSGMVGIGLILVGLTVVNIVSRQRDAHDRQRQLQSLVAVIGGLRSAEPPEETQAG